jgi:hypothetical protein
VHAAVVAGRVDRTGAVSQSAHQRRENVDDERRDEEA